VPWVAAFPVVFVVSEARFVAFAPGASALIFVAFDFVTSRLSADSFLCPVVSSHIVMRYLGLGPRDPTSSCGSGPSCAVSSPLVSTSPSHDSSSKSQFSRTSVSSPLHQVRTWWRQPPPEPGPRSSISPPPSFLPQDPALLELSLISSSHGSPPLQRGVSSLLPSVSPSCISPLAVSPTPPPYFSWDPGGGGLVPVGFMFGFYVRWLVSQSHIFISAR
jgi:hypothetical protein